jgi:transposase
MQIAYPRQSFPSRPWQPLTDAEYAALARFLPSHDGTGMQRRGRPPEDRRRTLDAIFWVACSKLPWSALPPGLGKPDTAHRTLRRWAHAGVLDRLLVAISPHPLAGGSDVLRGMAFWICRAWRRMARLLPLSSLLVAKNFGLMSAWPARYFLLPDPNLSETAKALGRAAIVHDSDVAGSGRSLFSHAGQLARACQRLLRIAAHGNRRDWRVK